MLTSFETWTQISQHQPDSAQRRTDIATDWVVLRRMPLARIYCQQMIGSAFTAGCVAAHQKALYPTADSFCHPDTVGSRWQPLIYTENDWGFPQTTHSSQIGRNEELARKICHEALRVVHTKRRIHGSCASTICSSISCSRESTFKLAVQVDAATRTRDRERRRKF